MVMGYHDDPRYIAALQQSVEAHWARHARAERLLMSFQGIPRESFLAGDPYHCQCHKTARLLAESLALRDGQWSVAFQSRFGPRKWLEPYTDVTLKEWARSGVKSVDVICPGFAADCLETLEEINIRYREAFLAAGGERFGYIPALNDTPEHITALARLVLRHTQGWPETSPSWNAASDAATRRQTKERACILGSPQ